jgi:NAD(P)-dependent dehydrogenase (short-subunit alcohol dehydrogenase family)
MTSPQADPQATAQAQQAAHQLTILTGASRGMGLAMAEQLLAPGHTLLCISRHANPQLAERAEALDAELLQWCEDLAEGAAVSRRLVDWLGSQGARGWSAVTLINNAGVIPPIAPLGQSDVDALAQALRVGLEAPMQLSAAFLQATAAWPAARKILNISSGLGRRAMASQSAYCAAKAGLDHFTRCMALDEALQPNGARVCSLAPGVIDTDMQVQLRSADDTLFPDRAGFAGLHQGGQLSTPADAARRVLAVLARADFGLQPVADVRD